ncbi:MAG: 2-hydroxyacid dehydrogenase [Lachnospiraceae bacterium]
MKHKIAFFDTKSYDREWFEKIQQSTFEVRYLKEKLKADTAALADGCEAVVVFVNDTLDREVLKLLKRMNIHLVVLRCTGFNNVDLEAAACEEITVLRVPVYSPYAVAEHAMALILALNRKVHRAYIRTRDYNFRLDGLMGFDLHGKTVGVVGTGKIGRAFIRICQGFGMEVLAYDPYPAKDLEVKYVPIETIFQQSDVISFHCPLTESSYHMLNEERIKMAKKNLIVVNTSRGALIDTAALLKALKEKWIGAAGLDVYEEESEYFFEDYSEEVREDDLLSVLISFPNVIMTGHQAFFTQEAISEIAQTTFQNLRDYFEERPLMNEIC